MARYVAFLRGLNVGRHHRLTNDELCACFEALGFEDAAAFLASGNVVFSAGGGDPSKIERALSEGLALALGYAVPAFVRSAAETKAIAALEVFSAQEVAATAGKIQVALLAAEPPAASRRAALALATRDDLLAIEGRELYWLPRVGISTSELEMAAIERVLGAMTVRTKRTVERIVAKYFS